MGKPYLVVLSILVGAVLGFLLSRILSSESIPKGYVRITVNNQSGKEIDTLTLRHEAGYILETRLKNKESINLYFENGGEDSYWLRAVLKDGKVISSKGEYVEAGYRNTEILLNDQFKTERNK